MAYDLEEQEQIASFKAFWSKYGNLITWVLIIALGSFAAYNFYNQHVRKQSVEASALYDELTDAVTANDNAKAQRIAGDIDAFATHLAKRGGAAGDGAADGFGIDLSW